MQPFHPKSAPGPDWPEAMATVLTCTYTPRLGRAIAFGLPSSKHFHITYNYWANDALHEDELFSERPIPQGSIFPIRYDPARPHLSRNDAEDTTSRAAWPLLTAAGILSVAALLSMLLFRGCF